ncbi:uncharacterized protein LOC126906815 isoform X2 [Daktulosphaira vitifoliae]|uniref:uncharacterized protein LOC126906815 isoform X2 n=1 Tax=Daktulosphaira vitifoliae TaxID=58002 RepID=UPI0021AA47D8|nr:uncharacterized protein LOC126906815 isoform X2 [Daktulosphaira vitifoliae]
MLCTTRIFGTVITCLCIFKCVLTQNQIHKSKNNGNSLSSIHYKSDNPSQDQYYYTDTSNEKNYEDINSQFVYKGSTQGYVNMDVTDSYKTNEVHGSTGVVPIQYGNAVKNYGESSSDLAAINGVKIGYQDGQYGFTSGKNGIGNVPGVDQSLGGLSGPGVRVPFISGLGPGPLAETSLYNLSFGYPRPFGITGLLSLFFGPISPFGRYFSFCNWIVLIGRAMRSIFEPIIALKLLFFVQYLFRSTILPQIINLINMHVKHYHGRLIYKYLDFQKLNTWYTMLNNRLCLKSLVCEAGIKASVNPTVQSIKRLAKEIRSNNELVKVFMDSFSGNYSQCQQNICEQ